MPPRTSPPRPAKAPAPASALDSPVTRRTLKDSVYEQLCDALMAGEFRPGAKLTVADIAARMGLSPMPVREAFLRLTGEGVLEALSNGTTRVPLLDTARLAELTEIRLEIEGLAARRAASLITAAELQDVQSTNERMVAAIKSRNSKVETRENEQFHFLIYRAARSQELLSLIRRFWLKVGPFLASIVTAYNEAPKTKPRKSAHHDDIIAALRQRDGDKAEAAIRADISDGAEFMAKHSLQFELE
jgi:DNA-binding GntR family transcriptional regulator